MQRIQIYLEPETIEQIRAQYPGLATSQAIRAFVVANLQDAPTLTTKKGKKYIDVSNRYPNTEKMSKGE